MIVSAAIAIAFGVTAVRWVVRQLTSKLLLPSPGARGRGQKILPVVGYVAALGSLPFALFLGVTVTHHRDEYSGASRRAKTMIRANETIAVPDNIADNSFGRPGSRDCPWRSARTLPASRCAASAVGARG